MKSTVSVGGHPVHPMLIPIPVGLWIFSLICDIGTLVNRDPDWNTVANYTLVGGIIGALVAALPGSIDLYTLPPGKAKRIGVWHMGINLAIVVLYMVNFLWRRQTVQGATGPFMLSVLAIILLLGSGWLGGELVYVEWSRPPRGSGGGYSGNVK